jgi:hypothetical protein
MKIQVIDAGVAVEWFLPEGPHIDHALERMLAGQGGGCLFLQPSHWVGVGAAVLARRTPATAADAGQSLPEPEFVETAAHATLPTADERDYARAAAPGGVRLLRNLPA